MTNYKPCLTRVHSYQCLQHGDRVSDPTVYQSLTKALVRNFFSRIQVLYNSIRPHSSPATWTEHMISNLNIWITLICVLCSHYRWETNRVLQSYIESRSYNFFPSNTSPSPSWHLLHSPNRCLHMQPHLTVLKCNLHYLRTPWTTTVKRYPSSLTSSQMNCHPNVLKVPVHLGLLYTIDNWRSFST
jgi:hypothetical protein